MEPYFFGRSKHLFGFFHPCLTETAHGSVVVAPPLLSEATRSNYVLREIATRLSHSGYNVLRFDFSGCGDSFGDLTTIRVEHWINDLMDAAKELQDITGATRLSVFSVRFSCWLAAAVSADIRWDLMFMWDPLLRGSDWIERLTTVSERMRALSSTVPHEYMGELTSSAFANSIKESQPHAINARKIVSIITDNRISVDQSWDCRWLELDSRWDEPFLENLFSHQIIEETVKGFAE